MGLHGQELCLMLRKVLFAGISFFRQKAVFITILDGLMRSEDGGKT